MAIRRRRGLLRRPAVLFVAFVSIIALTGVVYAHWYTDTTVQGNIQAGNLGVQWWAGGTDDDGILNNDWSGNDADDDFGGPGEDWDANPPNENDPTDPNDDYQGSSADPKEPYPYSGNGTPGDETDGPDRWNKDVAVCEASGNGGTLQVDVRNAYPSYWCSAYGQLYGDQQIPVSAAGAFVYSTGEFWESTFGGWAFADGTPWTGPVANDGAGGWCEDIPELPGGTDPDPSDDYDPTQNDGRCSLVPDGWERPVFGTSIDTALDVTETADGVYAAYAPDGRHVLTVWITEACGGQIDPFHDWDTGQPFANDDNEPNWGAVSVHLEQDAEQGANYVFAVHPRFVNWNEFDPAYCSFDVIDGPPPAE